jgi:hypothetical protein
MSSHSLLFAKIAHAALRVLPQQIAYLSVNPSVLMGSDVENP